MEKKFHGKSMAPGGGGRFAKGVSDMENKGYGADRAKAVMAAAGRKKFGKEKFQEMAEHGKARAESHSHAIHGDLSHPSTPAGAAQHLAKASAADQHGRHMHSVLETVAGQHAGHHGV